MLNKVNQLKEALQLIPHPEGGFYRETFRSTLTIKALDSQQQNQPRQSMTSIYYLLTSEPGVFSAWHRFKSDEIWYFHEGGSLYIYIIDHNGHLQIHLLGSLLQDKEAVYQVVVPADCWFAAEVKEQEQFTLVSCGVAPGFEFMDFELANKNNLIAQYSQYKDIISRLTR